MFQHVVLQLHSRKQKGAPEGCHYSTKTISYPPPSMEDLFNTQIIKKAQKNKEMIQMSTRLFELKTTYSLALD